MNPTSQPDGTGAAPSSPRWGLTTGILLTSVPAWFLLGRWVASGSERFYLLVPPAALALTRIWPGLRRPAARWQLALALLLGAGLPFLCVGYNLTLTAALFPASGGWWRGLSVREVAVTLYFLLALYLIVSGTRRALRDPLVRALGRMARLLPRGRRLAPLAAEGVLLLGLAPFLVSTFHVHRFKVPNPERPAELAARPFEAVCFQAADGLALRGWFVPAERPSGRTLLICHGMGANRTHVLPYRAVGDALGANVLLFDFRGHGDSDGHTVSFGRYEKRDVRAAVRYLREERPSQAQQVIGLGISMGTAGLVAAAAELVPPFDAIVLDSGFAVAAELTDHLLRNLPALLRPGLAAPAVPLASLDSACWLPGLRPVEYMAELRAPVLVIHATGDRLIPASQGLRLYDAANEPRNLWLADTGDHGSAFSARSEYLERVTRFVQAHCRNLPAPTPGNRHRVCIPAVEVSRERTLATVR